MESIIEKLENEIYKIVESNHKPFENPDTVVFLEKIKKAIDRVKKEEQEKTKARNMTPLEWFCYKLQQRLEFDDEMEELTLAAKYVERERFVEFYCEGHHVAKNHELQMDEDGRVLTYPDQYAFKFYNDTFKK